MDFSLFSSFEQEKFTIFAGAGISFSIPTCLPLSYDLSYSVVSSICSQSFFDKSEEETLKSIIQSTRPEVLFSMLFSILDHHIYKPIHFFTPAPPNINHFMIASLAKKNKLACIITTNFDLGIEYALEDLNVPYRLFVTMEDYIQWDMKTSPLPIFKIHGSTYRFDDVVNEKLDVLIENVGKPLSEPKYNALKRLLETTNFLVIGYSGRDDFDIYPVFLRTNTNKQLIWISHQDSNENYKIIDKFSLQTQVDSDHIDRLVKSRIGYSARIEGNTTSVLKSLLDHLHLTIDDINISEKVFDWDLKVKTWGQQYENTAIPYLVKGIILGSYYAYQKKATKNYEIANKIADNNKESRNEVKTLILLAVHQMNSIELEIARKNLENAIGLADKNGYDKLHIQAGLELGNLYLEKREFNKSISIFERILPLSTDLGFYELQALIYHNIGVSYSKNNNIYKAIDAWEKAALIRKERGNVTQISGTYYELGNAYYQIGDIDKSIESLLCSIDIKSKVYSSPEYSETIGLLAAIISNRHGYTYVNRAVDALSEYTLEKNFFSSLTKVVEFRISEFRKFKLDSIDNQSANWLRWLIEFLLTSGKILDLSEKKAKKILSNYVFPLMRYVDEFGSTYTLEFCQYWYNSKHSILRWLSASWIGENTIEINKRIEILENLVNDNDYYVKGAVAHSFEKLSEKYPKKILKTLNVLAHSPNLRVREIVASSLETLVKKHDRDAIKMLRLITQDMHPDG